VGAAYRRLRPEDGLAFAFPRSISSTGIMSPLPMTRSKLASTMARMRSARASISASRPWHLLRKRGLLFYENQIAAIPE